MAAEIHPVENHSFLFFFVKLPAASHHPQDMLPKCEAVKLSQAEANVKAEVMQKKQVVVYSHADVVLVIIIIIIIACIYAKPFFMKPNVFLKYESVNSECTPVTRNRAV